jgi:1-phosphatidylinositol-4-phosphate 5-kinase
MTSAELKLVKQMMPGYIEHLKANPDSLLSKILGIFTVESEKFSKVHIMIMENTIRLKDKKKLKFVFDLKGSQIHRDV